jgi:translation initiation factor IF-3
VLFDPRGRATNATHSPKVKLSDIVANRDIKAKVVRLIGDDGKNLGLVETTEALQEASTLGLDLVQLSDGDTPSVKITDLGKLLFERQKAEKRAKKNATVVKQQEIRFSFTTDEHDLAVKAKKASEFISEGSKVKILCTFKGREGAQKRLIRQKLEEFVSRIQNAKLSSGYSGSDRNLMVVIEPA